MAVTGTGRQPVKARFEDGTYQYFDGQLHKKCTGPAHDEPTYLPATDKYFYTRGSKGRENELTSRCRLCQNWNKLKVKDRMNGWIPLAEARPFYVEAANRIGAMELAQRAGLGYMSVTKVINGRGKYVQRRTLRKVMLELVSIKRKNEYSISPYAAWRVTKRATGNEVCAGCNGPLSGNTAGCKTCWERNSARDQRQAKLTTG